MSGGNERERLRERIAMELRTAIADDFDTPTSAFYGLADRILALLPQVQEPVGYVVLRRNRRDLTPVGVASWRATRMEAERECNGFLARMDTDQSVTYTVEPVGASPVASAPKPFNRTDEWHEAMQILDGVLYSIREGTGSSVTADELRTIRNVLLQPASAPEEEREAERKAFYAGMDAGTSMCDLGYLATTEREQHFQKWLRATPTEEQR